MIAVCTRESCAVEEGRGLGDWAGSRPSLRLQATLPCGEKRTLTLRLGENDSLSIVCGSDLDRGAKPSIT